NTDKTTFICYLEKPLILHKRILIATPPFAERESGFEFWFAKTVKLAQELSIPILFYCNTTTAQVIQKFTKKSKITANFTINDFDEWEDFLVLAKNIQADDLFVLVSARKGSVSYMGLLENLPGKLEKHFASNSRLVIYPQRY